MIYVASPYSNSSRDIEETRYRKVMSYVARMFEEQPHVIRFSPIKYWHPTTKFHDLPTDAAPYAIWNRAMLEQCNYMELLMMPGWASSKGVAMELAWAQELEIDVRRIEM